MTSVARSIRVFGIVWVVLGALLFLVPPDILVAIELPDSDAFWTRLCGMLIAFVGIYYIQASRHRSLWFFRATIWFRIVVTVVLAVFVFMGTGPWFLIVLAAFTGIGAVWTLVMLRGVRAGIDIPEGPTSASAASPAVRLAMHYVENLVERPSTNEGLLEEYVRGYRRLDGIASSGAEESPAGSES